MRNIDVTLSLPEDLVERARSEELLQFSPLSFKLMANCDILRLIVNGRVHSMEKSIFISYSHRDISAAKFLQTSLQVLGYRVWLDETSIRLGQNWADEIERALEAADIFILLASPDALNSQWVKQETSTAKKLNKNIIPILVGNVRGTDLPVFLRNQKIIDLHGDNAIDEVHTLAESLLEEN